VVPKKVNKVKGIKYIKAKHFIGNGQVFTVGDSYNDMEMIKNFQGYAVLNAIDEIKELAHEVVDGVFKVVERTEV
jgi:hydroxymethylpyrimidine pyrophosphatase-like HAD family hydrolase